MNDPRLGLPSASKFAILEHCPGSEALIRSIPPAIELEDEDSQRGTRIHKAWETGNTFELSEDELEDLGATTRLAMEVFTQWKASLPEGHGPIHSEKENRIWLRHPQTLELLLSGQFDELHVCGDHALVLDLKSGWCKNLVSATANSQLKVLAVVVAKEYECRHVQAAFIKPKISRDQIDYVDYLESDLEQAERSIYHSLWKSQQSNAPRAPGPQCVYCPAKAHCPEAGAYSLLPSAIVNSKDIAGMVATLSPTDLIAIQERASLIKKILDEVNERLKSLPESELSKLGWKIGKGRALDPIKDTHGAFEILKTEGIDERFLLNAMNFSKKDLTNAVAVANGWPKVDAEKWWKSKLASCIEKKNSVGSLEKI